MAKPVPVNRRMVTATALAQLGSALVDIYGQRLPVAHKARKAHGAPRFLRRAGPP